MNLNSLKSRKVNNLISRIRMTTGKTNVKIEELKGEIIECSELRDNMILQVSWMLKAKKLCQLEMKNNMSLAMMIIISSKINLFSKS
jgi:hypothetical protein